jgi:hypothetical protein
MITKFMMNHSHNLANSSLGGVTTMQNKTTLQTHNEILTVNEPWHRGSGFTWMLLALAGLVFFLSGAVAKAGGDIWDGYIQVNGTWYNTGGANNSQYADNVGDAQDSNRTGFNSYNFGTQNYNDFGVTGFSVLGWIDGGSNTQNGGANYKLWKSGSEPAYTNYYQVNGMSHDFPGSNYSQYTTSQTTQLIGADWINGDVYNLKVQTYTTIDNNAKFYEATATVTIGGARQLYNSSSNETQASAYNTSATGGLLKQGTGTLTLAVDNSNSTTGQKGDIYITAGTIAILPGAGVTGDNALGGSSTKVRLGETSGSSAATFTLADTDGGLSISREINVRGGSNGTKTISSLNTSGENTLSGKILLDASVDINSTSGGTLVLSGNFDNDTAGDKNVFFIGNGTVSLSGSASNIDIASYTVNNGSTLKLNKSGGADAVQSTLNVNGTAQLEASDQLGQDAKLNVNSGGTFAVGTRTDTFGSLTNRGTITGTGTLTASTYELAGGTVEANLGTGTLNVTAGSTLNGTSAATTVAVSGSGTDLNLGSGANRLSSSADVTLANGSRLNLTSSQTLSTIKEAGTTNGGTATIGSGAILTVNGSNRGTNYMNSISGAGGLTMSGSGSELNLYGTQGYTGKTTVTAGTLATQVALASTDLEASGGTLESKGADKFADGATITVSGGTLKTGGNDTITRLNATSGTLNLTDDTLTVTGTGGDASSIGSGAEMVGGTIAIGTASANSGTLTVNSLDADNSSALSIASGGTLTGTFRTSGALSVDGTLAPGNSTGISYAGATTFLGGGRYQWEIDTFGPGAEVGTNWDFLDISGSLTISASSVDKFWIDIVSLLAADDTAGLASNFSDASDYTFAIATASGGISGYDAAAFSINTSGFQNTFTGTWGTSVTGNSLNITYTAATAIPEPSSASMLVLGLAAVLAKRRRVTMG